MIKVALGQMEVIPGRPDMNTATMLAMISEARCQQAQLIIFPEMAIPGYLLGDTWEQDAFLKDCEEFGKTIIAASQGLCIVFGNVAVDWDKRGDDGRPRKYNACFVANNGTLAGGDNFPYSFRVKTLHPNYREFDDDRHFFSLRKLALELGQSVEKLLKPVTVNIDGSSVNLGCILCEDGWSEDYFTKPIHAMAAHHNVNLFINISSSPFTTGKNNKRNRVFSKQAAETGTPLVYVNNVGLQNNGKTVYTFDGYSTIYDRTGAAIAYCPPFTSLLYCYDLDLTMPGVNLDIPDDHRIDSIFAALAYGAEKFLNAIGMTKVVIGVSGGIDSAVAASLYTHILGPENVLLVNMPSKFNSVTTKSLAAELAGNLGCYYTTITIQESVDHTVKQVNTASITGGTGPLHLSVTSFMSENIQARDRSARVLAAAAAAFGGGFTCNANKSEMTVGYATLYGDQAGFLAALADLWKHQVYDLARHINSTIFAREVIPQRTIDIVPSAELSFDQAVDEGKGDPIIYSYHDFLFRAFVERWRRATPEDILQWYADGILEEKIGCQPGLIGQLFATPSAFIADLERWWKLYTGLAVAKRIQAPPVLAMSRRAYGFDHREAQNGAYFTQNYHKIKAKLQEVT